MNARIGIRVFATLCIVFIFVACGASPETETQEPEVLSVPKEVAARPPILTEEEAAAAELGCATGDASALQPLIGRVIDEGSEDLFEPELVHSGGASIGPSGQNPRVGYGVYRGGNCIVHVLDQLYPDVDGTYTRRSPRVIADIDVSVAEGEPYGGRTELIQRTGPGPTDIAPWGGQEEIEAFGFSDYYPDGIPPDVFLVPRLIVIINWQTLSITATENIGENAWIRFYTP